MEFADEFVISSIELNDETISIDKLVFDKNVYKYSTKMVENGFYVKVNVFELEYEEKIIQDDFELSISRTSGVYNNPFDLKLELKTNKNLDIRYILDCSEVNEVSPIYTRTINIKKDNSFLSDDYVLTKKVAGEYSFKTAQSSGYMENIVNPNNYV